VNKFKRNQQTRTIGTTSTPAPISDEEKIKIWFDQAFIDVTKNLVLEDKIKSIESELEKGSTRNIYELQCYLPEKNRFEYPLPDGMSCSTFMAIIKKKPLRRKISIKDNKLNGCFIEVFVFQDCRNPSLMMFPGTYYDRGVKLALNFDGKASNTECNII